MILQHAISLLAIISVSALGIYRASYFKNKKLARFSLHQILYLFVFPSIIALLLTTYSKAILATPRSENAFISDSILFNTIILSILCLYAGQAVHVITKSLYDAGLKGYDSEAAKLNRFYHLNFSHNFIFGGLIFLSTGLVLLEMNHVADNGYVNLTGPIVRGVVLGLAFIGAMCNYVRPGKELRYRGLWSDLKVVFALSWFAMIAIIILGFIFNISYVDYQFALPTTLALTIINSLNIGLILRKKIKK